VVDEAIEKYELRAPLRRCLRSKQIPSYYFSTQNSEAKPDS